MSTHNISFLREIRKISVHFGGKIVLSGDGISSWLLAHTYTGTVLDKGIPHVCTRYILVYHCLAF